MPLKWEFPVARSRTENNRALRSAVNWKRTWIEAVIGDEVSRFVHEYRWRIGGATLLRRTQLQREIENRIFRDVRWVERSELTKLDFLEADLTLVKDLAAGKIL